MVEEAAAAGGPDGQVVLVVGLGEASRVAARELEVLGLRVRAARSGVGGVQFDPLLWEAACDVERPRAELGVAGLAPSVLAVDRNGGGGEQTSAGGH